LQTRVTPFDSATVTGNLSGFYVINGTNLGSATSVTFNGYTAYFNRALVTDNSIVVQVPSKTPYLAPLATDSLVVTTLYGKASYTFKILPPPPTAESYSNYNFYNGSQIALTGVGFASVTGITLTSTGTASGTANVTIVSQTDTTLVLQFPTTAIERGVLAFTYTIDGATKTITDAQELVDLDNAYQVFIDGYAPSWGSWSWDGTGTTGPSTAKAKTGTTSFLAFYKKGNWWIDGFRAGGGNATDGVPYSSDYKYLSFWVYGGTEDEKININWGNAGFGQNQINQYDVPPGVWTYYKIPIGDLLWNTGTTNWAANSSGYLNTIGFFIAGPNNTDETLYFDDVVLVK